MEENNLKEKKGGSCICAQKVFHPFIRKTVLFCLKSAELAIRFLKSDTYRERYYLWQVATLIRT